MYDRRHAERNLSNKITKFATININGFSAGSQFLMNKYNDTERFDMIAIQETEKYNLKDLDLDNMTVIWDTNKAKNHGAALYINNSHSITKLETISKISNNIDSCWGLAVINKTRIIVGSIYVKRDYKPAIQETINMLKEAKNKQKELKAAGIILTGDFNARHQSWGDRLNDYNGKQLVELLDHSEYSVCASKTPTFLAADNANSLIDLFIISNNLADKVENCRTDESIELNSGAPRRGHVPVILELTKSNSSSKTQIKEKLDIDQLDWNNWTTSIEESLEEKEDILNSMENPYTLWNQLNKIITKATDLHGKYKKSCEHSKPYWTPALTILSNNLKSARKRYIKRNTDPNLNALIQAREAFDNERKSACQEFLINKVKKLNSAQARQFWKDFNKIFKKKSSQKIDPIFDNKNQLLTDVKDIEECMFSVFFEANHLSNGNFDDAFIEEINNIYERIISEETSSTSTFPQTTEKLYQKVTVEEIKKAIKCNGKSADNCGFHPTMLKHLGNRAISTLEKLFNLCLETHQWVWDGAEVIFLRKEGKDSYSKPGSYRPICITSYLGKLFEAVMAARIEGYQMRNYLTDPDQEGFSSKKNTIRYLNRLHLGIEADKEKSLTTLCLFVDFEKAFDSVWKKGLIYKLHNIGIRGNILKLINHFLFSRKVSLNINGEVGHERQSADYGLPQGSCLSPVLFKIYVTDFLEELNQRSGISVYKFADDGTVKITAKDSATCVEKMNYVLDNLQKWTKKWKMKINCDRNKTEIICFHTAEGDRKLIPESFTFGRETINRVSETTVLGLKIDENLSYIPHSQAVLNNLNYRWATLCKFSNRHWGFSQRVMLYLVVTLFISKLSYAGHIWITEQNIKEIEKLWYRILKAIIGAVLNIKYSIAEIILGIPPISIQNKVNRLKHFLKLNNQPIENDRYKEFLESAFNSETNPPTVITRIYKDLFKFLEWKIKKYPNQFNSEDLMIINNKNYARFLHLSQQSCRYTKGMITSYTDTVLWLPKIQNQFQLDGYSSAPTPISGNIAIPRNTNRNTEVLLMSLFYKNNLLNQSLWNISKVPSPLCSACQLQEETAEHLLFNCNSVDQALKAKVLLHYRRVNNLQDGENLDSYVGLLNARADEQFIISCLDVIRTLNLRETVVL